MAKVIPLHPTCVALSLQEAVDAFLDRDWSPNTRRNYAADLTRFAAAFGERVVDTLEPHEIKEYLDGLTTRQGQPVSPATHNRHFATLQSLLGWLERQEEISVSPLRKADRRSMPERLPRPLTPTQVDGFFSRIESLRDRALFSLLYRSGLRVGEALALNIEDMNSAEGTLRVIGKGNRERVGYLSEETARLIRRMLRERGRAQSGPLFASRQGRLSYAMAHRLFSQYASGLSETESLTIHQLRHSFGSERAGHIDALLLRDLMGHQSLRTTQQYAKVNPEAAHAAFRAFDKHKSRG